MSSSHSNSSPANADQPFESDRRGVLLGALGAGTLAWLQRGVGRERPVGRRAVPALERGRSSGERTLWDRLAAASGSRIDCPFPRATQDVKWFRSWTRPIRFVPSRPPWTEEVDAPWFAVVDPTPDAAQPSPGERIGRARRRAMLAHMRLICDAVGLPTTVEFQEHVGVRLVPGGRGEWFDRRKEEAEKRALLERSHERSRRVWARLEKIREQALSKLEESESPAGRGGRSGA